MFAEFLYMLGLVLVVVLAAVIVFVTMVSVWVRVCVPRSLPSQRTHRAEFQMTVGFFHPYCNAGGGGERVLWVAIRALQKRYKHVDCVVYTGDTDASPGEILRKARDRFNITLPRPVTFIFLKRRAWVEAASYPSFTLLGQSLGSLVLGWEALTAFVPDIYIDTMGYAFTLPLFSYIGGCRVGCYVHYPTISTDMMEQVSQRSESYNNERFISRSPVLSWAKLVYYRAFATLYGAVGRSSEIVLVNSSWTCGHIRSLWKATDRTHVVYPPCDTAQFTALPLNCHTKRDKHTIVSIAQFRPEKDHALQIRAFHQFLQSAAEHSCYELVLVGSCRDEGDSQRVQTLRDLCAELKVDSQVTFQLNVKFEELKKMLNEATVGLHTMWNEHFGIGVVEIMAAGTIVLAHDSGGPKLDIVVDYDGEQTGFLANDVDSYAAALHQIFAMTAEEQEQMCKVARKSCARFSEQEFELSFIECTELLFV